MKKIINAPERFIPEMLEGIYAAHPDELMCVGGDLHCLVSKRKHAGKVGIATGGGSGHLPLFLGYVGEGMLDGCSIGDVFQSPSAEQMLAVTKEIDQGAGVLYIYGNYNGDIFNFDMAAEMADMEEDIRVESVVAGEDVASAGPSAEGEPNKRRGVAGIFFVYKCAGAAAAAGLDLDEVKRVAEKACANVRTMGVALTSCTVPRVGHPSFEIGDDEMEIGMGIHGEPGIRRGKLRPADEIVDEMLTPILSDLPFQEGDEVAVLINGLGAFCFGAINNRRNDWLGIPFCCHIGWVFTRTGRRSQSLPVPYIRRGMVPRSCYKQCRLLVGRGTNDLDSHKGDSRISSATNDTSGTNDATVDSLGVGADRNGVLVVVVAAVTASGVACAVLVINDNVIEDFSNHLIDSVLANRIGNCIHVHSNFVVDLIGVLLFSIQQNINIADIGDINAVILVTHSRSQTIGQIACNPSQLITSNVLGQNIQNTSILHGVLQVGIQIAAVLEVNICRNLFRVNVCGNTSLNGSRHAIDARLDGVGRILRVNVCIGAASQHGDSHDTGQHQGSNFLELHNEFFLLMVYKR